MEPLLSLEGKNIIVTGASSGIGRECAIKFSELGANVILLARNQERLEQTYEQLKGDNQLFFPEDITEFDKLEFVIKQSVMELGKISGFLHSAGIEMTLPLRNMKSFQYEALFSVNVIAGFELAKIISKKKYVNQEGASFIFLSSVCKFFYVFSIPFVDTLHHNNIP